VCDQSGQNGAIAGVPAGFSIVIPGLIAHTDFLVVERSNLPNGYAYVSKVLEEGTYEEAQIAEGSFVTVSGADGQTRYASADGRIKAGHDAQVTITNRTMNEITVKKAWENAQGIEHGTVHVALFRASADSEPDASQMVSGTLRELTADEPVTYSVGDLANYVVREVLIETSETGVSTITPVKAGGVIAVSGESSGDARVSNDYVVSYEPGEVTQDGAARKRIDTVVNELNSVAISLMKVSWENTANSPEEHPLAGAEFSLFTAEKGGEIVHDAEGNALEGLTSGDDGVFFDGRLVPGVYYLEETHVPDGYYSPAGRFRLIVGPGEPAIESTWIAGSPDGRVGTVSRADKAGSKGASEAASKSASETASKGAPTYVVAIRNTSGIELPNTGGPGTWPFLLVGLLLAFASTLYLVRRA